MARHYIATAKFNPYSYQELAAPIARATAILSQQAANLDELDYQNASIANYLDPILDKRQYDLYQQNKQLLQQATDRLSKYGLDSNTYNTMHNLNTIYMRDIKPIQQAIVSRAQYNAGIAETLSKNPDMELKGPLNRPLDEFYNGVPKANLVSGNAIKKDVSDIATIYAAAHQVDMTKEKWSTYQDLVRSQYGYSLPELEQAKQPGSFEHNMMMQVLMKHGVIDANQNNLMNDDAAYQKMLMYAQEGLNSLLGKQTAEIKDNDLDKKQDWIYKQQHLALQRQAAEGSSSEKTKENTPFIDTRNVTYSTNVDGTTNDFREWVFMLPAKNQKLYNNALVNVMTGYMPSLDDEFVNELLNAHGTTITFDTEYDRSNGNRANNLVFDIEYIPKDGTTKTHKKVAPEAFGFTADEWDNIQQLDEVRKFKFTPWELSVEDQIKLGEIFTGCYNVINNLLQQSLN